MSTAVAAIGALWFTGQSLQSTQRQVAITEQGQYTDRYTKAVEQLGSQQVDVRQGAVYALERLARDSTQDRRTIAEVLSAFVRNRLPLNDCPTPPSPPPRPNPNVPKQLLPTDLRAAVAVRQRMRKDDLLLRGIDLMQTCLKGIDLSFLDLQESLLSRSNLTGADLTGANLTGAWLSLADVRGAGLHGADLTRAHLISTDLANADLTRAHLIHTDLTGANLPGADLTGAIIVN